MLLSLVILQAPTKQERSNRHQLLGDIVNNYTRAQIIGSSNPILFDLFKLATSDPTPSLHSHWVSSESKRSFMNYDPQVCMIHDLGFFS